MKNLKLALVSLGVFFLIMVLCYAISQGIYTLNTAGKKSAPKIEKIDQSEIWNKKVTESIAHNEIILGMTDKEVIRSIGIPYDKQKNVGKFGVIETWEYPNLKYKYLHFENSLLTGWQEN